MISLILKKVVYLLKNKKYTIGIAESCTGGLIAKRFTDIPGSSIFFKYGVVSYSNEAKIKILKVKKSTIEKYGAVSQETAKEMVLGIKNILNPEISISVTGIAGPTGGSKEKPVGTVFIGICFKDKVQVYHFQFKGSRKKIRLKTFKKVLFLLLSLLEKGDGAQLY